MLDIFLGSSYNGTPTGQLSKRQVKSFEDFCTKYLSTCVQGEKNEYYITIANMLEITPADPTAPPMSYKAEDHYHRNNKSQISAWLLPFDGDNSNTEKGNCIEPIEAHKVLVALKYNHAIYTTHSHVKGIKNRWRLFIPCKLTSKESLQASVDHLFKELNLNDLAMSTESKTWSVPWFLPTRDNPDDEEFEYYAYFSGRDFNEITTLGNVSPPTFDVPEGSRSFTDLLETVSAGVADTGLHAATRDLAYGLVRDGLAPGSVKSILHFLTRGYHDDVRQKENREKIDPLVDSAVKKTIEEAPSSIDWETTLTDNDRVYTDYPNQSGLMEEIVDTCMKWMPYPNRQIAVIAAHSLISTLGGRVYTLESGSGVVLTALVTGRSTIGKSFIKKFCIFALNNFQLANTSQDFIGSHFYTSSKNLVEEIQKAGSLLSVRTESGQSDKSSAGDMTRVLMYELELATESGSAGYVSSGGQNEKIPSLFSPAVTTIRESVAFIQNEADIMNATSIAGVAGRRSHVLIDPLKGAYNEFRLDTLPNSVSKLILGLYKKAANEQRKSITQPLPRDLWCIVSFKNPPYLTDKRMQWIKKENQAAADGSHFESTFYGRLGERLPSWAARLAICDNPNDPNITNQHVDIAEASLMSELDANSAQQGSGELDSDINQTASFVIDMFRGDMTSNKSLSSKTNEKMLKDGACELHRIMNRVRQRGSYKRAASHIPNVDLILLNTVKTRGLIELTREESVEKYKYRGRVLKRV